MTDSAARPAAATTRRPAPGRRRAVAAQRRVRALREERRARWYGVGLSLAAGCLAIGLAISLSPVELAAAPPAPVAAAAVAGVAAVAPNGTVPVPGGASSAPTRAQPIMALPVPEPAADFIPYAPHGVTPSLAPPTAECGGYGLPRQITPGIEAGVGQATASWQADGRASVVGYRVSAVTQDLVSGAQPDPPQQTVRQPDGCGPVTLTMTGLRSGGSYVFWLEEEYLDESSGVQRFVQTGWSQAVVIG